jgi:hypothetical protein
MLLEEAKRYMYIRLCTKLKSNSRGGSEGSTAELLYYQEKEVKKIFMPILLNVKNISSFKSRSFMSEISNKVFDHSQQKTKQ